MTRKVLRPYSRSKSQSEALMIKAKTVNQSVQEVVARGINPVELMINAMREYNDEAEDAFALAETATDPETREQLRSYGRIMIQQACDVAKDAAPYIHPRLNAVSLYGDEDKPPVRIEGSLRTADTLRSLVRGKS